VILKIVGIRKKKCENTAKELKNPNKESTMKLNQIRRRIELLNADSEHVKLFKQFSKQNS
jgi:hypothetical protein